MFDDIRPYYDSEINAAMKRITADPLFPVLSRFVFPHRDVHDVANMLESFDSSYDFQHQVMYKVNERIIEESISSFTCSGAEKLEKGRACLFVSNHRDIGLTGCSRTTILPMICFTAAGNMQHCIQKKKGSCQLLLTRPHFS